MTRDEIPPRELRRIGREQLAPYETVQIDNAEARRARRVGRAFEVTLDDGRPLRCRKLLLATGVVDEVPALEGIDALYGQSVFHCPYARLKMVALAPMPRASVSAATTVKPGSQAVTDLVGRPARRGG